MADILIACEESGKVRDAFIELGYDAVSCDILPTSSPGPHIQGDVRPLLKKRWRLIIAHPPCTYLTNSGVRWLYTRPERWQQLEEGAAFFKLFLDAKCKMIAVENPIMHKHAIELVGRRHDQLIQPYHFGHTERKATCLWLKGLPPLVHTNDVREEMKKLPKSEAQRLFMLSPSPDRARLRSQTYSGIAKAMAEQWGALL